MYEEAIEAEEFVRRAELCVEISTRIIERLFEDEPEDGSSNMFLPDRIKEMDEGELFRYKADFSPYELFDTEEEIREGLEWSKGIFALVGLAFKNTEIGRIMDGSDTPLLDVITTDYADEFFARIEKIDPNNPDIDIEAALRYIYFYENGEIFRRMLMTVAEVEEYKRDKMDGINRDRAYITVMFRVQASYMAMVKLIEIGELTPSHNYSIFSLNYPGYNIDSDKPNLDMHTKTSGVRERVFLDEGQLVATKTRVIFNSEAGNEQFLNFESKPIPANKEQRRLALSYLQALINKFEELEELDDSEIRDFINQPE